MITYTNVQARNETFFRAGQLLWNQGASVNISSKKEEKILGFYLLDTLKTTV